MAGLPVSLVTEAAMPLALMHLEASPSITIDTETSGLNVRNGVDYLTGICVATEDFNGYMPFRHERTDLNLDKHKWRPHLANAFKGKKIIWHNQKFDWHSFYTFGMDPLEIFTGLQFDTMVIAHLLDEEMYSKELDFLAKKFIGVGKIGKEDIDKLGEIYGYARIPPEVMAPYGANDAVITRDLCKKLWPLLVQQGLDKVYLETEGPFIAELYKMERHGVGVDKELATTMAERGRRRMSTIHREFKFNPGSTKELGKYLLDELGLPVLAKTPKGKPSFNKNAMAEYDEILQEMNNPAARLIAEYRGWQKATTSLYEPLLNKVGPDGRIRTQFKPHGTVTGRLSASDPNLQQVPRGSDKPWNGKAKACFISGIPDFLHYGWDYSQIELRLAAAYGREQLLLADFASGRDPFITYCEILFGAFTPEGRQHTKTFFYANLYGAGLDRIDITLGWNDLGRTEPIFRKFRSSIPGIARVSHEVNQTMYNQGYISYWDGRRRHIKKKDESHKAWNSMIQGGAAQLVKKAIIRCGEFADSTCYPVLTVHDEISFMIHKDAIPDYEPKITKAMTEFTKPDGSPLFPVKLAIEGKEWK